MTKRKRNKLTIGQLIFQKLGKNIWGFQFPLNGNYILIKKYDEYNWQAEFHSENSVTYSDIFEKKEKCLSSLEQKLIDNQKL